MCGCRCDDSERLKVKTEGSTRLTYTGLRTGTPIDRDEVKVFRLYSLLDWSTLILEWY
jgi:hypothetical protein